MCVRVQTSGPACCLINKRTICHKMGKCECTLDSQPVVADRLAKQFQPTRSNLNRHFSQPFWFSRVQVSPCIQCCVSTLPQCSLFLAQVTQEHQNQKGKQKKASKTMPPLSILLCQLLLLLLQRQVLSTATTQSISEEEKGAIFKQIDKNIIER